MREHLAGVDVFELNDWEQIAKILQGISGLRAGVIGDSCLDLYWQVDMQRSQLSRETPHYSYPVVAERHTPGGAANVAVNLKRLGCAEVHLCTVIGKDWRGELLRADLQEAGVDVGTMTYESAWSTPAYCKPILRGLQGVHQEAARLDFINSEPLSQAGADGLASRLAAMAARVDVIVVTDQISNGIICASIRERLRELAQRGKLIVVDSREHIAEFGGMVLKPNELEAMQARSGRLQEAAGGLSAWVEAGRWLAVQTDSTCCLTLGGNGALWLAQSGVTYIPTALVEPPLDIVGAGDCFAAALAAALASGSSGPAAAAFAHLGAAVSVRKLGGVGSADPGEIRLRWEEIQAAQG